MSSEDGSSETAKISARELTLAARQAITDLTGYKPEAVTGLQWDNDAWHITVDVLELERVPNTTDVMGTYVVQLDDQGRLVGYQRERRFVRGATEDQR